MDKNLYQSLLSDLSESERLTFESLLSKLELVNGDIKALSEEEQLQLAELASAHADNRNDHYIQSENISAAETSEKQTATISKVSETMRPMETEFGAYMIDNINESLCQGGASTTDAIRYAFHNRWMPDKLKNRDICEDLFYRYYDDIEAANKGIQENSPSNANNDTVVAVGLAWFTNLYRCYQLVEAEGDI
ncbi:MAG: hypothetical protein GY829_08020 [Gammaproteobacteria bacterium]|nr:hypothetical protein [Gammaproteobacteria bacterium]